jgi:molybdenum cofactor cytidylyltransferase
LARIACILLGAGSSVRMGEPKLLRRIGGRTIFEIALANHLASSLPLVCAVIAGWIDGFGAVRRAHNSTRVRFVEIDRPCRMAESLKAGWEYLKADYGPDAVMISLADKPLVTAEIIDVMIRSYEESPKMICVPVHGGIWGHPVIISSDLEAEIMASEGDVGARRVLARHSDEVEEIDMGTDAVLLDIDSAEDLGVLESRFRTNG